MREKGFTLLELLAVLMIMGVLLLVIFPNLNSSNNLVQQRVLFSQFESVFNKSVSDAITLTEDTYLTLHDTHYSFLSSKVNPDTKYLKGAKLENEDVGTVIDFDKNGNVLHPVQFTFTLDDEKYEFTINIGRKNIYINGIPLETFNTGK